MRAKKGFPFMHVEADSMDAPIFSEHFLYSLAFNENGAFMTKGDARYILGVAEEYERLILLLGSSVVGALLEVPLSEAAMKEVMIDGR